MCCFNGYGYDLLQLGCSERGCERIANTFPCLVPREKESRVEGRVESYELRSIRELPKVLDQDLLDYFGVGDNDDWCSTEAHLMHSAILVEVIQEHFVHAAIFVNIRKIADPWPRFGTWQQTIAENRVVTLQTLPVNTY